MIEKIKQNPKKFLGIVAGIFFLAAILFMLLPGVSIVGKDKSNSLSTTLFALSFGGTIRFGFIDSQSYKFTSVVNIVNLISFILLAFALIGICILIYGLIKNKFNKKTIIILVSTIIVFSIVSAILTFICKNSAVHASIEGIARSVAKQQGGEITEAEIQETIKTQLELIETASKAGIISVKLGVGSILSPIMAILGSASACGVVCLSGKKDKLI